MSTHHLLDHKPDNLLRTAHKHGLTGFYKFGTPGIAVLFGEKNSIDSFAEKLKGNMPQKKFQFVLQQPWEGSTPTVYHEVTAATLKEGLSKLGILEDDYYTILGIEKRDNASNSEATSGKAKKGKKKGKK